MNLDLAGKRVTVLGLGKSGKAAVKLLYKLNAKIQASDINEDINIKDIEDKLEVVELGRHSLRLIEESDLVVLSPGIDINKLEILKNKNIISELELAYKVLLNNISNFSIIAITGTNGKSTATTLLWNLLKEFYPCKIGGNIEPAFSEIVLDLLENPIKEKVFLILEVSSFQLDTSFDFKPDVAIFLNFSQDHMDRYKNLKDYFNSKLKIFKNQDKSDYAILNIDDPWINKAKKRINSTILFFSKRPINLLPKDNIYAYVSADDKIYIKNTCICEIKDLKLKGKYNIENILAVLSVVSLYDNLNYNSIKDTLINFNPLPHRLEYVKRINNVDFINDSKATNPAATYAGITAINNNSPIILILGGQDKSLDFSLLNPIINQKVKYIILYGQAKDKIERMLNFKRMYKVENLKESVRLAKKLACPGDTVLFSPGCASFDAFSSYKQRGEYFKELVTFF